MNDPSSLLRGMTVGLFVLALSAGACDGGGGASTGMAGSGMAGEGGGGAGGSMTKKEGASCPLGTTQNCDPVCGTNCGTSAACIDICCTESTSTGIICNGVCQETCTYQDQNDPACAAATAMLQPDKTCTLAATVKGRDYALVATPDASGQGMPEVHCSRVLPDQPPKSLTGVAPGRPCTGDACMTCTAALAFWKNSCCGL